MTLRPNPNVIETHPLTPDRWRDFAALMNSKYYTRRCWCMAFRRPDTYRAYSAETNRRAIKRAVDTSSAPPGVLAYVDGASVGWCAIAPRDDYPWLDRTVVTARVDETPVWSVVCFYVLKKHRLQGVSRALLTAAITLASEHGAKIVEAYPLDGARLPFPTSPGVFHAAGFEEVARRKANRPILRYRVVRKRGRRA